MIEISARMFSAETHIGVRGQVYHQIYSLHCRDERLAIEKVCLVQNEIRIGECVLQKAPLSGREVIETDDTVARGKKTINHMTADKAGCAGD